MLTSTGGKEEDRDDDDNDRRARRWRQEDATSTSTSTGNGNDDDENDNNCARSWQREDVQWRRPSGSDDNEPPPCRGGVGGLDV